MLTDTHCHLTAQEYQTNLAFVMAQAIEHHVTQFIVPATQPNDWQAVLNLLLNPSIRTVALGVHPWFAQQWQDNVALQLNDYLQQYPHILVGEIGLDFLHDTPKIQQIAVFRQQINIAKRHQRPIIVHSVKAHAMVRQIIHEEKFNYGGIIHAFSGSLEEARLFIKQGFKIGIGSLLLNPNAKKVRLLAQTLPLETVLLETDSPYMQPNNQNTPANVYQIAQIIAQLRAISVTQLAQQCEKNLNHLLANILPQTIRADYNRTPTNLTDLT